MRDLVKDFGKKALNNIGMSSQKAAWFLIRLPKSHSSRQVHYILTQHPFERAIARKTQIQMNPENVFMDSTDIWKKNIIQYYECRSRELETICLADYVSYYNQYKRRKGGGSVEYERIEAEMKNLLHNSLPKFSSNALK